MPLSVVTAPTVEPVTLAEAKAHLRLATDDDDTLVSAIIPAARAAIETRLRRSLLPQTWLLQRPAAEWKEAICLPRPPLIAVDWIKYLDESGTLQTVSANNYFVLNSFARIATIHPLPNVDWPVALADRPDAFRIQFQAGYANAAAVPRDIHAAILLEIEHQFEGSEEPRRRAAIDRMISPHIIRDNLAWRHI